MILILKYIIGWLAIAAFIPYGYIAESYLILGAALMGLGVITFRYAQLLEQAFWKSVKIGVYCKRNVYYILHSRDLMAVNSDGNVIQLKVDDLRFIPDDESQLLYSMYLDFIRRI